MLDSLHFPSPFAASRGAEGGEGMGRGWVCGEKPKTNEQMNNFSRTRSCFFFSSSLYRFFFSAALVAGIYYEKKMREGEKETKGKRGKVYRSYHLTYRIVASGAKWREREKRKGKKRKQEERKGPRTNNSPSPHPLSLSLPSPLALFA